mmetsp:Transcript_87031/g.246722  ORF Transcript_87031/g.246722 Transcript_87031/m.246722 type:complete len:267 (+) Transcript_87031:525-1325(+)
MLQARFSMSFCPRRMARVCCGPCSVIACVRDFKASAISSSGASGAGVVARVLALALVTGGSRTSAGSWSSSTAGEALAHRRRATPRPRAPCGAAPAPGGRALGYRLIASVLSGGGRWTRPVTVLPAEGYAGGSAGFVLAPSAAAWLTQQRPRAGASGASFQLEAYHSDVLAVPVPLGGAGSASCQPDCDQEAHLEPFSAIGVESASCQAEADQYDHRLRPLPAVERSPHGSCGLPPASRVVSIAVRRPPGDVNRRPLPVSSKLALA